MKISFVCKYNGFMVYKFIPNLFCLVWDKKFHNLRLLTYVWYMIKFIYGKYLIYYTTFEESKCYYCFVNMYPDIKHRYLKKNDILIGPYFTSEDYRCKSIASNTLADILADVEFSNAYVFVRRTNKASCRVVEKLGFQFYSNGDYRGVFRKFYLSECDDSLEYVVYKKEK